MRKLLAFPFILFVVLQSCVSYDDLINEGKEHSDNGNKEEAQLSFEKALKKDSTRPDAYYGLGFLLADQCRNEHTGCEYAVNYFTRVIRIDSNFRHAFYNRANAFMQLGKYKEALHDLNIKQSVEKEDIDYHGNRVICYLNVQDTANAIASYQKVVKLDHRRRADYMEHLIREYRVDNDKKSNE